MDPIPKWLTRIWEVWDVRMLVLLSLTFQIILFISGKRRKYLSSLWINIIVWATYLMADFVAMVALGKLSDKNNTKPKNGVTSRAIWAPLLLLHLGGPDTITVYSTEDKQLWKRHIIGVGVQIVFAGYVIFLSWRKSLLSIMSVLASVAGMIKFGERIWVLKLVSNDEWGKINILPDNDEDFAHYSGEQEKYVSTLMLAGQLVKKLWKSISRNDPIPLVFESPNFHPHDDAYTWDVLEVEMGLMFDLLYTKATITYTKVGCILRSISFTCMMFMLVESLLLTVRKDKWPEYTMVDIAITIMLVGGALALDFCAVVLLLSSDWIMLWLVQHKTRELVIKFCKKNPWFFYVLKRRKWSKRMRQFDLLGFCIRKAKCSMLSKRLGLLSIVDNLCWYMHRTCVEVPPKLPGMILSHLTSLPSQDTEADQIEEIRHNVLIQETFEKTILIVHIATEICYNWEQDKGKDEIKTCRTLSHFMMYLLLTCPSMLPIDVSHRFLDSDGMFNFINNLQQILKSKNVQKLSEACQTLENMEVAHDELPTVVMRACHFASLLKKKQMKESWKIIEIAWLNMLCYTAIKAPKNDHFQLLRQGGDLLTLVWLFVSQIRKFRSYDFIYPMVVDRSLKLQLIELFKELDTNMNMTEILNRMDSVQLQ